MSVNLIGISGRIGAGKDAIGSIIQYLTRKDTLQNLIYKEFLDGYQNGSAWQIKKFAYKLKQIVSLFTGISVEDLEKQEVKDRVLGDEWEIRSHYDFTGQPIVGHKYTVRELLQRIGTEAMRDQIHKNIWVNALFSDYKQVTTECNQQDVNGECTWPNCSYSCSPYPKWIITDVRFPNEAHAIKQRGGLMIRVNRPSAIHKLNGYEHPSETALDDYEFDEIITNDGTLEDLQDKVKTILIRHEI